MIALVDEGARGTEKDPSSLRFAFMCNAFVVDGQVAGDPDDGWPIVREGVIHQFGAYESWEAGHDTPDHDSLEPHVDDEDAARDATAAGTPERVVARLAEIVTPLRDRDIELIVRLHYPGMDLAPAARAVELFGEHVLPALKGS